MLDVGRRFMPIPMLENILDTMAIVKLNILHFHASDYCRFAIQSKLYPQLTFNTTTNNHDEGVYTQDQIKDLIVYAAHRGIRIVPEFDLPGHVYQWGQILSETTNLTMCHGTDYTIHHNTSTNASFYILRSLLQEMSNLFDMNNDDENNHETNNILHIGNDEVVDPSPCTANGTLELEQLLVHSVLHNFQPTNKTKTNNKTNYVMGWTPMAAVASSSILNLSKEEKSRVIINSYYPNAEKIMSQWIQKDGYNVVDSDSSKWYFTHPAGWDKYEKECRPAGCKGSLGWEMCWSEPGSGSGATKGSSSSSSSSSSSVLGGEMSMWTDDYVERECGAHGPSLGLANASCFHKRKMDQGFQQSIGGLLFPRGLVAAGAFYHYNSSVNASSLEFAKQMHLVNEMVMERGGVVCPSNDICSYIGKESEDGMTALYDGVVKESLKGYSCSGQ